MAVSSRKHTLKNGSKFRLQPCQHGLRPMIQRTAAELLNLLPRKFMKLVVRLTLGTEAMAPLLRTTPKNLRATNGPYLRFRRQHRQAYHRSRSLLGSHTRSGLASPNPWVFRPVAPGPPNESIVVKPIVPEFIPPIQYGIKPQRLCLRRSESEILTGFDDDVSSVRDDCTARVMSDKVTFRESHMTYKQNVTPVFRKAFEKKPRSPELEYGFDTSRPNRLLEQTRISISNWNPGPRRGKPGAFEKHIAGKWHIIACRSSSSTCIMNASQSIFMSSTSQGVLCSSTRTRSFQTCVYVHIHDIKTGQQIVREGQAGWVLQGVISRATFRRTSRNGNAHFTIMSLHFNNSFAK